MKILVGNTGLVGQTLKEYQKFDFEFNSKNINDFEKLVPDNCEIWLSCLPATKWMVNKNLEEDLKNILNITEILKTKTYSKIILISTIDVYNDSPLLVNEDYNPNFSNLSYGNNRLLFEKLIELFLITEDLKIYRLPALFNKKIKKNILFDLLNNNNVENINVNSQYQWFNLDRLFSFIEETKSYSRKLFNVFTEPVQTFEILKYFPSCLDKVKYEQKHVIYNYKTNLNDSGYIQSNTEVITDIKNFINEFSNK